LGLLRDRIALRHVQLEKESVSAAERRADMQTTVIVQSERKISPVEIKKDSHPEVWSAWRDQLEPRHMRNPAAGGVGMYQVLWFGHRTKRGPVGQKPQSARELAENLDALISAEYVPSVVGLAIDLSRQLSRAQIRPRAATPCWPERTQVSSEQARIAMILLKVQHPSHAKS
jgi:hypothetical protein